METIAIAFCCFFGGMVFGVLMLAVLTVSRDSEDRVRQIHDYEGENDNE